MVYENVRHCLHVTHNYVPQDKLSPREMQRLKICMLLTAPTHLPNRVNHCII